MSGHLVASGNAVGKAYGLAARMKFELGYAGPVHFYFVPALGIAYVSNTYFTHSDNRFIGSHLNQLLKAALQMEIPLGENFGLLANVHVLHISNGGFNIPNSGLNTGNISLGLRSRFGRNPTSVTSGNATRHFTPLEGNSMEILAGIGRRGRSEKSSVEEER